MEQQINHSGQGAKAGNNYYARPQVPPFFESLQLKLNFNRVAAANHLSRFTRPADLDEFVRGFYAL